ncbi:MAG: hypothetical protein CK529_09160 [Rhodospirillaceae bacterium]|nr:MAG: hypothetical protein CK529_09160 [Rhodospirillaceae bacterium]
MILSGELAVKQASMFDSFSFDAFAFQQDRLTPAEVDVRRGQIVDTFTPSAPMRQNWGGE